MAKVAALTAALERAYRRAAQAERREQTQVAKYRDTVKRLESEKSTARQQVEYYRREYTRWEKQYNDVCVLSVNLCVWGGCACACACACLLHVALFVRWVVPLFKTSSLTATTVEVGINLPFREKMSFSVVGCCAVLLVVIIPPSITFQRTSKVAILTKEQSSTEVPGFFEQ